MSNIQTNTTSPSDTINKHYQERIMDVFTNALVLHKRLFVNRFDLRFPHESNYKSDSRVISRFNDSIKAQLNAREKRKEKAGKRIHSHGLEYAWVREIGPISGKAHYHIVLIFNKDAFFTLGQFDMSHDNLYTIIVKAWNSALGVKKETQGLVEVCDFGIRHLDENDSHFKDHCNAWLGYLDYLAKHFSKPYGDGKRSFGCSR